MTDVARQLAAKIITKAKSKNKTLIVGINGAQGSGKSTLCKLLQQILQDDFQQHVVVISIDDLYKTKAERQQMAQDIHPLFLTRGVPGTHDVQLGTKILNQLLNDESTAIPVFDKAIDDRVPEDQWQQINNPVDIVLFEGWCIGAKPQPDQDLLEPVNELESQEDPDAIWRTKVNNYLASDYQKLFSMLDMLIMLKIPSFDLVYQHRLQQEQELAKQTQNKVMSDAAVKRFVMHYQRLTEFMLQTMPQQADIVLTVDSEHNYRFV